MSEQRVPFPSMVGDPRWPGAWKWGVDVSNDADRVLAVATQGSDSKYGTTWLGPVALTTETAERLEAWAKEHLDVYGGYVHLFPADGDAREELQEWWDEREDEDD